MPDVAIELLHVETGRTHRTVTDGIGQFVFPVLPVGRYEINVDSELWRYFPGAFVDVAVGRPVSIDLFLRLRAGQQGIVVRDDITPLVDARSSSLGSAVPRESVERLPLNQREFFRLALLAEGVHPPAPGSELSRQNDSGLNVFGAREAANNYLLDGVDNNDAYINRLVVSPPLDSIREFRLHAANYKAEFGRSGGAQANVVSRSGTNRLHASFYEYLRNEALDARNFFDPFGEPIPQFRRNQFGASLGGPIKESKAFYFVGFEGTRIKDAVTRTGRVPTPAELGGDFSAAQGPVIDVFAQAPFPNNRIPADRLDPVAQQLAKGWATPNRADPLQNVVSTPVGDGLTNQVYGRGDWYVGEKDALYVRYKLRPSAESRAVRRRRFRRARVWVVYRGPRSEPGGL